MAILDLCVQARRSPDRFLRRGTRWITAYEFFVCENGIFELPHISRYAAREYTVRYPWRMDQIYNGLKSPDQELME